VLEKSVVADDRDAHLVTIRFKTIEHHKETRPMSTAQTPTLDMTKLNAFVGQFVTDLGAAVHTGMVVIGKSLAVTHELGHAICAERNEAAADRFGEELRKGHTPPCRIARGKGNKSKGKPS
jgi:precorrin-6B methylase 2